MSERHCVGVSDYPIRNEPLPTKNAPPDDTHRWWELPDDQAHRGVSAVANELERYDSQRRSNNAFNARLYGNQELISTLRTSALAEPSRPLVVPSSRLGFNVIESCASTVTSIVAKSKPKPDFLTDDGDAALQTRAKWLTKYVEGVFYEGDVYNVAQRAFVHALVFGTGIVHAFWKPLGKDRARIDFEWVLPDEILIDAEEGRYGSPRQLHRRKRVPKEILIAQFPKHRDKLLFAGGETDDIFGRSSLSSNVLDPGSHVIVTESWHLPSAPDAGDGKHVICTANCTLLNEEWEADYFPFTFFNWKDPLLGGFWGVGMAQELMSIQREILRLCRTISESQRIACIPRVFIEDTTHVPSAHINDIPGGIVRYRGQPPVIAPSQGSPGELYSSLNDWIRRAYEQVGVSQLQASSQKPAGINSGIALREYSDNASGRLSIVSSRWDDFFMEIARKVVDMSRRRFQAGDKKLSVKAPYRDFVRTIKWKDVDLEADAFVMKVFPVSSLPTMPSARKDTIIELLQAGLIPKEYALSLLDYPDLKAYTSLATAALEDIKDTIDRILEEGKPGDVDEMTDLNLCVTMGTSAVLRAKNRGVPDDRIELLRRWVDECRKALQQASQPQDGSAPVPPQDNSDGGQGGNPLPSIPGIPGRASGGPVQAGRPYVVGERGPELIVPQQDGNVVPNHQLDPTSTAVNALSQVAVQLAGLAAGGGQNQQRQQVQAQANDNAPNFAALAQQAFKPASGVGGGNQKQETFSPISTPKNSTYAPASPPPAATQTRAQQQQNQSLQAPVQQATQSPAASTPQSPAPASTQESIKLAGAPVNRQQPASPATTTATSPSPTATPNGSGTSAPASMTTPTFPGAGGQNQSSGPDLSSFASMPWGPERAQLEGQAKLAWVLQQQIANQQKQHDDFVNQQNDYWSQVNALHQAAGQQKQAPTDEELAFRQRSDPSHPPDNTGSWFWDGSQWTYDPDKAAQQQREKMGQVLSVAPAVQAASGVKHPATGRPLYMAPTPEQSAEEYAYDHPVDIDSGGVNTVTQAAQEGARNGDDPTTYRTEQGQGGSLRKVDITSSVLDPSQPPDNYSTWYWDGNAQPPRWRRLNKPGSTGPGGLNVAPSNDDPTTYRTEQGPGGGSFVKVDITQQVLDPSHPPDNYSDWWWDANARPPRWRRFNK